MIEAEAATGCSHPWSGDITTLPEFRAGLRRYVCFECGSVFTEGMDSRLTPAAKDDGKCPSDGGGK